MIKKQKYFYLSYDLCNKCKHLLSKDFNTGYCKKIDIVVIFENAVLRLKLNNKFHQEKLEAIKRLCPFIKKHELLRKLELI